MRLQRRGFRTTNSRSRHRRSLLAERLEDRSLLASVGYQLHVVAPDAPATGADLATVNVGDSYDVVVTVQDIRQNPGNFAGVFAGYLDIGYDSAKTHVQAAEIQRIRISPSASASGSFTLTFGGETTAAITFNSNLATLADSVQGALAALPSIGAGNVSVAADIINSGTEVVLQARFVGKFFGQDVPNLTVASQNQMGSPEVSVTYEGDLKSGASAYAFREAWRSRTSTVYFPNGVSAGDLPNLINDVGAFANITPTGTAIRELVRARFVATADGTVTFSPSVANIKFPEYYTLVYGTNTPVAAADIDVGTPKTLTIGSGAPPSPITAAGDVATVLAGSLNNVIDVLANDTTNPANGQSKVLVSVTQPAHGAVTFSSNNVAFYTPAADFVGTDTFTYTARNSTAGRDSATSTASVTVTVAAGGTQPSYTANPDVATMDEDSAGTPIDVLANDATSPEIAHKNIIAVMQPAHGSVTLSASAVVYTPTANFVGTDTFTYTAQSTAGGLASEASTATVTVTVNPVNDPPSFTKGADQETNDEAGDVVVTGWATDLSAGPADEANQTLHFDVTTDNELLFTIPPTIDSAGNLYFTPAPNADGISHVTVVLHDSGGTEHRGADTAITETFIIQVVKLHPSHNAAEPLDATGDTAITTGDAMTCLNYLNSVGPIHVSGDSLPEGEYLDVNGDGILNPADPLKVINFLNSFGPRRAGAAISVGEGEFSASNAVATDLALAAELRASPSPSSSSYLSSVVALLAADAVQTRRRRL